MPAEPAPAGDVNAVQNSVSQPPNSSSSSVSNPVAQLSPATPTAAMASESAITVRKSEAAPAKPEKKTGLVQSQPDAPAPQKTASAMPNLSGALTAHPITSRPTNGGGSDAPPALDAPAVSGNAIGESSLNLAVPTRPVPKAPLRVGGDIKPPRMISSALPVYPSIARQTGVEGNVVIETVVDETGRVASMKVVSGPPMLRQAALDALRQWKYEPSLLNGQPVSVQMIVTIQFHR
jgi:protein TonB